MKRSKESQRLAPQQDYGLALQSAVSWLGDRYLLAEPVPRIKAAPKPFFVETRDWLTARQIIGSLARKH
jgi:hypothetical protein